MVRYVPFFLMFARFALFKDTNLFRRKSLKEGLRHLSRHQDLFTKLDNPHLTRGGGKVWREPPCRTKRHLHSALPHLTRLLNGENS